MLSSLQKLLCFLIVITLLAFTTGTASAAFLYSLDFVQNLWLQNPWLIWFLPLSGLLTGYAYKFVRQEGNHLVLQSLSDPNYRLPGFLAVFVFAGTLITHLTGGSAGREGTAVQMGAVIGNLFSKYFSCLKRLSSSQITRMGLAAGFAGVFGTPLTAIVFSYELLKQRPDFKTLLLVGFCAFASHHSCLWWGISHTEYPMLIMPNWNWSQSQTALSAITNLSVAALCFGFAAWFFVRVLKQVKHVMAKMISIPLRPVIGAMLLIALTQFFWPNALSIKDYTQYLGLGMNQIDNAFQLQSSFWDPVLKILTTALTTGTGFQGGEVTPLFYIGATLGSSLSAYLSTETAVLTGLGLCSVFGAAMGTPIAATILAAELFGVSIAPWALITCFLSAFVARSRHQNLLKPK